MLETDTAAAASAPHQHVLNIVMGFWQSRCLAVATELDLAELLKDGPLPVDTLASQTQTDRLSLFRLMRALESIGVFKQASPRVFANTPQASVFAGARRHHNGPWFKRSCRLDMASMKPGRDSKMRCEPERQRSTKYSHAAIGNGSSATPKYGRSSTKR